MNQLEEIEKKQTRMKKERKKFEQLRMYLLDFSVLDFIKAEREIIHVLSYPIKDWKDPHQDFVVELQIISNPRLFRLVNRVCV